MPSNERKQPRKPTYFPGWTMVGISAAAMYMSGPGQSYSVAAFKDPMRESLSVSETSYSLAYGTATVLSGLLLPFVGRALDRFGARRILPLLGLGLAASCLVMSMATQLLHLYIGFALIRSLGQGSLTLVSVWLVSEWFDRRRGWATAIAGLGGSLSVMSFPILNRLVISNHGWEFAWQVHAGMMIGILVVPSILLVRSRPEDIGLLPDGAEKSSDSNTQSDAIINEEVTGDGLEPTGETSLDRKIEAPNSISDVDGSSWQLGDVLRDGMFWRLLAVPATSGMVGTGLIFHQAALLSSRGISREWALDLISLQALIATLTALLAGWLTDRLPARWMLSAAMILISFAACIVYWLPTPSLTIGYAVAMGLHGSILRSTGMVVWVNFYGRKNQGKIRGVSMAVMILAAAVGPLPPALSIDLLGSYDVSLIAFAVVPIFAAALVCRVRPRRQIVE